MVLQTTELKLEGSVWKGISGLAVAYALVASPVVARLEHWDLAAGLVLAIGLIALSVIDMRTLRLPNVLTLPLLLAGVASAHVLGWQAWPDRVLAAGVGYAALFVVRAAYYRLRGHQGLGLGDAKLFAVGGAWLGVYALPATLLWACALALSWIGLFSLAGRKLSYDTRIPFGPFLAAGIWLVWVYGPLFAGSFLQ